MSDLRTLGDSLRAFGLIPRLQQLEKSLEEVRRNKRSVEEHREECKRFDKELQQLSRENHPDRVTRRGGSEAELARAKDLQTAINAMRTVLKTLNKIFLEDIDVEHKYEFFTGLDIGLLGNEDEVQNQAYQVLFKISLISEIRQGTVVGGIRKFLEAGRHCIECYLQERDEDFRRHRCSAFFHLERCVAGYRKLHAEYEEVEVECRGENLRHVCPTIQNMKRDCSLQLRHLEALLELSKRPFGEVLPMYSTTLPLDDYFVLPLVRYVSVILACSVMIRNSRVEGDTGCASLKLFTGSRRRQDLDHDPTMEGEDRMDLLHQLSSCYGGDRQSKKAVKRLFEWKHMVREDVKRQFLEVLKKVRVDLEGKFRIDDYVEKGTRKLILKELKACREMMAEIEEKTKLLEKDIQEINKNNEYARRQLDEVAKNQSEVNRQLGKYRVQ